MTLTNKINILDDKIKANEAQYNLEREAANIFALSSKELNKYEYLTGEDLRYKPGVVEQAEFEYSPLGKVFNKGLKGSDKKEGLLKKLKNVEDINKKELEKKLESNKKDVNDANVKAFKKNRIFK